MRKHALDNAIEEAPPLHVVTLWHERTVLLRLKSIMHEEILEDEYTAQLVKQARRLTLFYLN